MKRPAPATTTAAGVSRGEWLALIGVVAVMFLAYQPAWWGTPIWDDDQHLTPPVLQGMEGLGRIWTDIGTTTQYYPLLHTVFWLLHSLWGDAVLGYHLLTLALHGVCTALVLVTLRRLSIPGALLAAALFALHPIQVESVAWMTELKNTLSTCFYLLAFLAYLRFDETRRSSAYAASLAVFVLALLTKSVTGMLPFTLAAVLWWKRGALNPRKDLLPLVPFAVLGVSMGLVTAWWEIAFNRTGSAPFAMTWLERGLVGGRAALFQLGSLVWPVNLLFSYPRWTIDAGDWQQYLYPLTVAGAVVAAWMVRQRTRAPLAAALVFLFNLAPTLGAFKLYTFRYSYVADHYQYIACLGVFTLAAATAWPWLTTSAKTTRLIAQAATLAILVALTTLTWKQSHHYESAEASYSAILSGHPESWFAHANLGAILMESNPEKSLEHLQQAIRLNPDLGEAHGNLGILYLRQGRVNSAVESLTRAVRLNPRLPGASQTLGDAYAEQGRPDLAVEQYQRALQLNPEDRPRAAAIRNGLGFMFARLGSMTAAADEHRQALALDPKSAEAHYGLGNLSLAQDRFADAVTEYRAALALDPGAFDSHNNLGVALDRLDRPDEAEREFREALKIQPGFVDAVFNLAGLLERRGRLREAADLFAGLLAQHPEDLDVQRRLAGLQARMGKREEPSAHRER